MKRTQYTHVDNPKTVKLCLHVISKEKRNSRYEFRCQPTLAKLLRKKGSGWVWLVLLEKLERENGEK